MNEINIEFFEQYKKLDKLCSEIYEVNSGGVTAYIEHMASLPSTETSKISGWSSVYRNLKELRHIRNQIAHSEGAFDEILCSSDDVKWLKEFHSNIMNVSDPLAIYRKDLESRKKIKYNSHKPEKTIEIIDYEDEEMYYTSSSRNLIVTIVFIIVLMLFVLLIKYFCF